MDIIKKILDFHNLNLPHYQKLERYYNGQHDYIMAKQASQTTDENHKVNVNWSGKIIDTKLAFFLGGDAIKYVSRLEEDELLNHINYDFPIWEEKHNVDLHKICSIYGKAYEMVTINEDGNFESFAFSPLEMSVLLDGTKNNNVVMAVRQYKKQFDDNIYVDVITDREIINYINDKDNLIEVSRKNHIFSKCPILFYQNNSEQMGDFEKVLDLIDEYDYIVSKNIDELAYLADAYFIIEGSQSTTEEELLKMRNNRIILTAQNSKAYFATKDLNGNFREKVLEGLENDIICHSNIVILSTTDLSSNISGVALRAKLYELENAVSMNEINLKALIYKRLKFYCEYLKIKTNKDYDYKNIIIQFSRNLPSNIKEMADIVQILKGTVSTKTLISQLPFVNDVDLEIKRVLEENGVDMTPEEMKKLIDSTIAES